MEKAIKSRHLPLPMQFLPMGVAALLPTFGMSIANVALPTFGTEFGASLQQVQWIVSGYLAALALFSFIAGRLLDIWGNRLVLFCGYSVFCLGLLMCFGSNSLEMLLLGRVVQGIGAAALAVVAIALAKEIGSKLQMGRAMGALATLTAVGTALGPSVGGITLDLFGWRSLFLVLLGVVIVGSLTVFFVDRNEVRVGSNKPRQSKGAQVWRSFYGSAMANSLVSVIMMTTFIAGPFFLKFVLGYSDAQVGLVMAIGPVISILSGVPAGFLVDRFGDRAVMLIGLSSLIAGALSFSFLPIHFGVLGYVIALIVLTPGYQMFLAANNSFVMRRVSDDGKGAASGLLNVSRNAGLIIGASVIAWVFSVGAGASDIAAASVAQISDGFQLVFWLNAGFIFSVALAVLMRRK
jgi:MFS family permease